MRLASSLLTLCALLLALPAQAQADYMDVATEADLLDGGTLTEVDIACIDRGADGTFVFFNAPSDELVAYDPDAAPGSRTTVLRTSAQLLADTGVTITACRALDIGADGVVYAAIAGGDNVDLIYRLDGGTATVLTDPAGTGDTGDGIAGIDVSGSTVYIARVQFFGAPEDGFYSIDTTTAGQEPTAIATEPALDLYDIALGDDGCLYSNSSEFGGTGFQNVTISVCDLDTTPVLSVAYDPFADGIFTNGSDGGLEDVATGPGGLYLFNNSFGATEGEQWGFVEYGGTGGVQFANEVALVADADVSLLAYTPPSGTHTMFADGVIYEASSSSFGATDGIVKFTNIPGAAGCDIKFVSGPDLSYDAGTRRLTASGSVRNNGSANVGAQLRLDYNRNGGNPQGSRNLGSGSLPPNVTVAFSINLRVPNQAPAGDYNFDLVLVDTDAGTDCATYSETISISAPRVAGGQSGELFEVLDATDFSATASAAAPAAVAPNPFARQTTISYEVAAAADVRLAVYDVLGREVAVLVDARQDAGAHSAVFEASDLAAGTYVYRLQVGSDVRTGRMTLAR